MKIIKKYWIFIFIAALFGIAVFFIYKKLHPKTLPSYLIESTGRIDGNLINLNTKYSGRVMKIYVDDGDSIKKGELIAVLGSKEYQAKKNALSHQINAKEDQIKAKEIEFEISKVVLENLFKKTKMNLNIKKISLNEIAKNIQILQKITNQYKKDFTRIKKIFKTKLIQKHSLEEAKLKYLISKNKLDILYLKKKELIITNRISKNDLETSGKNLEKINILQKEISSMKNIILAMNSQKNEIIDIINDMNITSPIDGYVDSKIANKGEVLAPGMSVATLIDPKSFFLKIYVDTINNGKIKIGDKAEIFLDAFPNRAIPAKVSSISKQAEFTPKEVAVRSDRITRVYEVHLKPLKLNPFLKLGIPAIGIISLQKNRKLPKSLKELPEL